MSNIITPSLAPQPIASFRRARAQTTQQQRRPEHPRSGTEHPGVPV